jgi:hypothetical protein
MWSMTAPARQRSSTDLAYITPNFSHRLSLEPTWPARLLEFHAILALGWPGGSARGRYAEILGDHRGLLHNGEEHLRIEMP